MPETFFCHDPGLLGAFDEHIHAHDRFLFLFQAHDQWIFFQLEDRRRYRLIGHNGFGTMFRCAAKMSNDGLCECCSVECRLRPVAEVTRAETCLQGVEQRVLYDGGMFHEPKVPEHGQPAQQQGCGIGDVLAGDVGRRAMDCLKDADMIADIRGGCESQSAYQSGAEVADNITLQVGQHHHVEQVRSRDQFHAEVVYDHIIRLDLGILQGHLPETLQEESVRDLHDVCLMSAGDASGLFFAGHLEGIPDDLHRTGSGDEPAAQRHVVRQHMLDASVGVFYIFTDDRDIDRNAGPAEYGVHTMQGLEDPLVGIGVPGLARRYVHTLHPFSLGCFHRPFEQDAERLDPLLRLGSHPVRVSLVEHPFAHVHVFVSQRYPGCLEDRDHGIHDLRSDPISFRYGYVRHLVLHLRREE